MFHRVAFNEMYESGLKKLNNYIKKEDEKIKEDGNGVRWSCYQFVCQSR